VRKTGGKAPASPCFIGFAVISERVRSTEILRRFHGVFPPFCRDLWPI
jgi:hypothetical protein